jgi:hypothetical protein
MQHVRRAAACPLAAADLGESNFMRGPPQEPGSERANLRPLWRIASGKSIFFRRRVFEFAFANFIA